MSEPPQLRSPPRRALLLGATGLIGSRCLVHLLDGNPRERVTCLVRRPLKTSHERLDERVVSFDNDTELEAALDGSETTIDDVFCALGSTMKKAGSKEAFRRVDYDLPLKIAKIAVARGAKRMALVSSVGADARSKNFYLKTKGELEEALEPLFASPEQAFHVFRPSFLVGDRQESRPGEAIGIAVVRAARGLMVGGLRKYRPIHVDRVARAMVAAVRSDATGKRVYEHDAIEGAAR